MLARLFPDLVGYKPGDLRFDVSAALAATFIAVPQGIAYAMIAGLPPAAGLFASALPTIVGSLFRSSSHVVAGPTNALSLLVGAAVATSATDDPMAAALVLALMVGVFQIAAGVLKLGAIIDYISSSVVAGYITGAGLLIGIGQLANITGTMGARGDVWTQVSTWVKGLAVTNPVSVGIALGTAAAILGMRAIHRKIPSAIVVLAVGVLLSWLLDLQQYGVELVRDIAPVPVGLPPLTLPDPEAVGQLGVLLPIAIAATVLSLVESNAVARSIASRTGQTLSSDHEFVGQGASNVAAGLFGGYPTSGSLSRSALNEQAGAKSRLAGVMSGTMMLVVLLFLGPIVDLTPIASLAGLLIVIAVDLVDVKKIRAILSGDLGDKLAFSATMLGTWVLPLDQAIYLGVGISIVLFLRRARQLVVRRMVLDDGHFREGTLIEDDHMGPIDVLHVEGSLFFGAANELRSALDGVVKNPDIHVLIVRITRTRGLDYTSATVLESIHARMESQGRHLFVVGIRGEAMKLLDRVGIADSVGRDALYPTHPEWFAAFDEALRDAVRLADAPEATAELQAYLDRREEIGSQSAELA